MLTYFFGRIIALVKEKIKKKKIEIYCTDILNLQASQIHYINFEGWNMRLTFNGQIGSAIKMS